MNEHSFFFVWLFHTGVFLTEVDLLSRFHYYSWLLIRMTAQDTGGSILIATSLSSAGHSQK